MLPRKLVLFFAVVALGALLSIVHFTFLRDFTSKTIIHVQETTLELTDGYVQKPSYSEKPLPTPSSHLHLAQSEKSSPTTGSPVDSSKVEPSTKGTSVEEPTKLVTIPASQDKSQLPKCAAGGTDLVGLMYVDQSVPSEKDIENQLSVEHGGTVELGGWWRPPDCQARSKVAIVIPFRNRYKQLALFLRHIHPVLQRQLLDYRIFVIEQDGITPFNRAGLFNVGFKEALRKYSYTCFIFSDVDLLPEDDRNNYGCPTSPRHMSVAVDKFNYRLPYETIFGGVGAFNRKDFESINGFSNQFWGWGGEDDDLYNRIKARGMELTRPPIKIGRYTMVKLHHFQSDDGNPERNHLLRGTVERMNRDGLNSLKYSVVKTTEQPLVTIVTVAMNKEDHM